MAIRKDMTLLRQLDTLFNLGAIRDLTDGQLLERYASGGGEGAELAFAALVERHAPLVLRVCRAQLGDAHAAQDAFQATFLILVKNASALWVRDSIGPWLHQVAFRTASCARSSEARRKRLERRGARPEAYDPPINRDWEQTIHEELNRLPERYRVPLVLCDLQGHSCDEAARRMGRPVGTVKCWRSRGRDRLRRRLARLGLAPAAVLAATFARAATPGAAPAVGTAVRSLSDQMAARVVPASVRRLVNGVLKAMLISKLRLSAVGLSLLLTLGAFTGFGAQDAPAPITSPKSAAILDRRSPIAEDLADTWPLSLREAIRIGLRNSEAVRVLQPVGAPRDGQFLIASRVPGTEALRFKSEVMALVRSIEEQYWTLNQKLAERRAAQAAVTLTEEIVKRERTKTQNGWGNAHNLDEAQQQLERFKLDLMDKTANLTVTERQLRATLGMKPGEGPRLVPVTEPIALRITPNWEEALAVMVEKQPDLVRGKARIEAANGPEQVEREKTLHEKVLHRTTHTLARFFLEVDSTSKLFRNASSLRVVADARLNYQRESYEQGKLTIDRYLDAVNRSAAGIAQEADFQARYNSAIVALEEAKGTLLDTEQIALSYHPGQASSAVAASDGALMRASLDPAPPAPAGPQRRPADGNTYSFQMTIGMGPKPIEIRGSFTVPPSDPPKER